MSCSYSTNHRSSICHACMVDDRSFHNCQEKLGSGTMLSQIMNLVETAQLNRAPVQRVADAVARCFVPGIVALSFLTWMTWYLMVYTWEALLIFCVTRFSQRQLLW